MKWDSPWGVGFPGWHIECSTIASQHLGTHFDIHCGGIDHVTVHHTNEIAQSEACFGHRWVNFWMHGEFLVLNHGKMSKSSGKYLTLSTLMEQGFDPIHYRYLCLTAHYRSQLFFSEESLKASKNAFEALKNRVVSWRLDHDKSLRPCDAEKMQTYNTQFWRALCDDLNTPIALSVMWEMAKDQDLSSQAKLTLLDDFDSVLGFDVATFARPQLSADLMDLIHERSHAREHADWAKADRLRDQLLLRGVHVKDLKEGGADWYVRD
jgi:cysteinyl-tRNA synthetase